MLCLFSGQKNYPIFMVLLVGFLVTEASYLACSSQCKVFRHEWLCVTTCQKHAWKVQRSVLFCWNCFSCFWKFLYLHFYLFTDILIWFWWYAYPKSTGYSFLFCFLKLSFILYFYILCFSISDAVKSGSSSILSSGVWITCILLFSWYCIYFVT